MRIYGARHGTDWASFVDATAWRPRWVASSSGTRAPAPGEEASGATDEPRRFDPTLLFDVLPDGSVAYCDSAGYSIKVRCGRRRTHRHHRKTRRPRAGDHRDRDDRSGFGHCGIRAPLRRPLGRSGRRDRCLESRRTLSTSRSADHAMTASRYHGPTSISRHRDPSLTEEPSHRRTRHCHSRIRLAAGDAGLPAAGWRPSGGAAEYYR